MKDRSIQLYKDEKKMLKEKLKKWKEKSKVFTKIEKSQVDRISTLRFFDIDTTSTVGRHYINTFGFFVYPRFC
ncbi:hypothetical protein BEH_25650 (plasmid) [Priestia filamentosa]|uniref:Uncharacterized protein n=1 Tax=Priestia filamentosa TaxID=1402861 RepID=A0A231S0T2_9BACI|nr:hypothetical protein BEH_25650 [Priestia filamentosa]OXS65044.1 hypothetical protein B1B01_24085 [Priestia filamentosa]